MITVIKILLTLAVLFLLAYPFIQVEGKMRKLFVGSALRYDTPDNRKNFAFILLAALEFILVVLIFRVLNFFFRFLHGVPFVGKLFTDIISSLNPQIDFILFTLRLVLVNLIFLYAFVFIKLILKKAILDPVFGLTKKKKKEKEKQQQTADQPAEAEDDPRKKQRIPAFLHNEKTDDAEPAENGDPKEESKDPKDPSKEQEGSNESNAPQKKYFGPVASFIYGLFFEGEEFQYARSWVIRVRTILQSFIVLVGILYALFFTTVLVSMFFPLPDAVYGFLVDTLQIGDWYIYPVISLLFLQEICNFFRTTNPENEREDAAHQKKEDERLDARLRKLLGVLKKHFDSEHSLRYYPEASQDTVEEYVPQNRTYQSAMQYIRKHMQLTSGRVVESYMQCLDASFNDDHVYFASSFYSELGEYLIAYTYIRLLSGSRVIYVVSDPEERATLSSFISERLMRLTGSSAAAGWRIYTAEERLDQADVLIVSPEDFRSGNMTAQYPAFFEEVSNAIFLDADRMISMDSYLCPVMATNLRNASNDRIRFVFLTQDLYKGFAARSLPKFFCVETVLSFSSAMENESVSYVLWNKESKSHRIYNRHGQKTTCLECMIADIACKHHIDGVRLMTDSALDHAERKILVSCGVEINKLYRDVVDVNYMIYSDERCNLAASIYACTRFRGRKKSVVHILSKPYLLREYFISKAATENFVNRSSFIQPRVLEHADPHKLSLLRIFCELTVDRGLPVSKFEREMQDVINVARERGSIISSAFCKRLIEGRNAEDLKTAELAAYLIAGLCDTDIYCSEEEAEACASRSTGNRAKEFYLIVDPAKQDGYTIHRERYILFNRAKEVFEKLFACNERVELRLNDEVIGLLDTFPLRTHLEYIPGQSIIYKNAEYEIEHISEDGRAIYLRNENVKLSHCLDTVHLRRYQLDSLTPIAKRTGVLNNTKLTLQEIRVTECVAAFKGETYGFYGLTSDKQTLDFYHKDGVDGNPHVAEPHIRNIIDGRILKVDLMTRMECTDGMRMLMAAVFNEFVRTVFPKAYHFISIVPVLETPLPFSKDVEPETELERIRALYPYLLDPKEEFIETDKNRITFLFINDCHEDIGAFQWFYDLSGRYMQEFLSNIYSYLHWLQLRPQKEHYIYFGGETLPECYDLEGCCTLLEGYNLLLSDLGEEDVETAGNDLPDDKLERCAFCHREMECGRYSFFDKARYICADCFDIVDHPDDLDALHGEVRKHLQNKYPTITFGPAKTALDPVYDLTAEQVLSEFYYRVDISDRTIYTERDEPVENVRVSLLRGLIELWQADNEYFSEYSHAQLYYEELLYLREKELHESADWIYQALPDELRAQVDEISAYTGTSVATVKTASGETEDGEETDGVTDTETVDPAPIEETTDESDEDAEDEDDAIPAPVLRDENAPVLTSFDFIRMKQVTDEDEDDQGEDFFGDDDFGGLYDPNQIPRFWKRYLRNERLDTGDEEDLSDAEQESDGTADTESAAADEVNDSKKKKKGKRRFGFFGKRQTPGEKVLPYEEDEKTNPKIRIYNEIVRCCYDYSEGPIRRDSITVEEFELILNYVSCDYPELFWLTRSFTYNDNEFNLMFRCKNANGTLDTKQINQKRSELKRAAKEFTKGISKRTDPYEALTTIYRRLILRTDYDSVGITAGVGKDVRKDDQLRSLHSTLVNHKAVCAGYSVAMQYLLQSVGIVTGYVISELEADGVSCHAFNILKLGKYCYYLDATWGDSSNTETGDLNRDLIGYDYFCVPYDEFIRAHPSQLPLHRPNQSLYPLLEKFKHTNHEYYRFRQAYLRSYNEAEIIRIIADAASAYDPKEMGEFTAGMRFATPGAAALAYAKLSANGTLTRVIKRAQDAVTKKGKAELLNRPFQMPYPGESGVLFIRFETPAKKSKKDKKSK